MAHHVLLTGATGFLGKVVLEQLLRRREELGVARVTVVIRGKRGKSPQARLAQDVVPSACFRHLPADWASCVDAVDGDLSAANAGLGPADAERLAGQITHVIHCAASVDFDRPLAEAAQANVVSSLNVLALAQRMPGLRRMVSTSTAYVTPWRQGPIPEALAELPRPAEALWADVQAGRDEKTLLAETGHANTYTYTKCLAEHLLVARRGAVALRIVRPSIISASWRQPVPGWIDSKAAFAGFVFTIGAGLLRVIDADPNTRLDIVPVDTVADRLVAAAFDPGPADVVDIVHAAVGLQKAAHIGHTSAAIVRYFRRHRVARRPVLKYLGQRNARFLCGAFLHHQLPHRLQALSAAVLRDRKTGKQSARIQKTLHTINEVFPYFTHNTFDFVCSTPMDAEFAPKTYVKDVCQGVATHLMQRDPSRIIVAGSQLRRRSSRLTWAWQRSGSVPTTLGGAGLRASLDAAFDEVSFDEASFVAASEALPQGIAVALLPSVAGPLTEGLLRLVLFDRPDLGLAAPAWTGGGKAYGSSASDDPSAVAGWRRWMPDAVRLPRALRSGNWWRAKARAAAGAASLHPTWFAEPAALLSPLAGSQGPGWADGARPVAILPVAVSFAQDLPAQLRGQRAVPADPAGAAAWLMRLLRGEVHLGAVHLRAGRPHILPGGHAAAGLDAEQQAALGTQLHGNAVAFEDHLRAFVALHPQLGIDLAQLRAAVVARGGRVVSPKLARLVEPLPDAGAERRLRHHWHHVFAADMVAQWPHAQALRLAFSRQGTMAATPPRDGGGRVVNAAAVPAVPVGLLTALARPIVDDWRAIGQAVAQLSCEDTCSWTALCDAAGCRDEATALAALAALCSQGIVRLQGSDKPGKTGASLQLRRLPHTDAALARFLGGCTLAPERQAPQPARLAVARAAADGQGR